VLADPRNDLALRLVEVGELRDRARRVLGHVLDRAEVDLGHQLARVRSLSPLTTLRRGYAILSDEAGEHVASVSGLADGATLNIRVADGRIAADVTSTTALDLPALPGDVDPEEEEADE
jgi:exodeoxyribonuclease VII large subunit